MTIGRPPVVGNWYRRADRPQAFHVVALDEDAGTVDVEYFDGTVDEWPLSHWHGLDIEACEEPRDWTGPFDDIEYDERGNGDSGPGRETAIRELLAPELGQIPPRLRRSSRPSRTKRGKNV